MTTGSAALYQVAVALIPALLFGGATLQMREGTPAENTRLIGIAVAIILIGSLVAEIIAISGAIEPDVGKLSQRYVVFVLTVGTAGLAGWIAAPFLRRASIGRLKLWGPVPVIAVLLFVAVFGQLAISSSLDRAAARSELEQVDKQQLRQYHELQRAEAAELAARTRIIDLARKSGSPRTMATVVLHALGQLDVRALSLARDNEISMENIRRHLDRAYRALNDIASHLDDSIGRVRRLNREERELLRLAQRRLFAAASSEMSSYANATITRKRARDACLRASLSPCG